MKRLGMVIFVAALASTGVAQPRDAASYTFDGFRLGALFQSTIASRSPYNRPCDVDPIDEGRRRIVVYGARPCRELTFPEGTTVVITVAYVEGPASLDQPVTSFAWMGGQYFSSRSDFPVRIGEPVARAVSVLGPISATFVLSRELRGVPTLLTVRAHPGNVYSLASGDVLVGFVVGPMPSEPTNEQWRTVMQMWARYTVPI